MEQLQKSPPWETFFNELKALFDGDADVKIIKDYTEDHKVIRLYVTGEKKADALTRLLPSCKVFGNVAVYLSVYPANDEAETLDLLDEAFRGNPNVATVEGYDLPGGGGVNYVVMRGRIVQFFDDNLGSYAGAATMLLEDAARDVFEGVEAYFCTEKI